MGLIIKEHTATGTRRTDVRTLYDTEVGLSCVRLDIAEILGETHTRPIRSVYGVRRTGSSQRKPNH